MCIYIGYTYRHRQYDISRKPTSSAHAFGSALNTFAYTAVIGSAHVLRWRNRFGFIPLSAAPPELAPCACQLRASLRTLLRRV